MASVVHVSHENWVNKYIIIKLFWFPHQTHDINKLQTSMFDITLLIFHFRVTTSSFAFAYDLFALCRLPRMNRNKFIDWDVFPETYFTTRPFSGKFWPLWLAVYTPLIDAVFRCMLRDHVVAARATLSIYHTGLSHGGWHCVHTWSQLATRKHDLLVQH